MDFIHERVWVDAKRMCGKPCIRGTRITVESIQERLRDGATVDEVLRQYPVLTPDDVLAAEEYNLDG
jgi:uncharacterized protein (DUF433 family)